MKNGLIPINHLRTLNGVELFVKRDDLFHEIISGNKIYKLILNVQEAKSKNYGRILTFGGAFSNHIAATSAYCKEQKIESVGIIRGEEHSILNPTLAFASECGMKLHYVDRATYRDKEDSGFLHTLRERFDNPYIIPEGGANLLGIRGAENMLDERCDEFDLIGLAIGTGTTFAGILRATKSHQKVLGFPIHKHAAIFDDVMIIDPSLKDIGESKYEIIPEFHFGGYAKWNEELIESMRMIHSQSGLITDPIYTGKALTGIIRLIDQGRIPSGSKVLFIHTGGLQGIAGFEARYGFKIF